ncbi:MAG: hypothetical protein M1831_001772 [Alyxoria varia]|nr:MAG: hypothetical protein M1831_001772 [Alyxoria varia]
MGVEENMVAEDEQDDRDILKPASASPAFAERLRGLRYASPTAELTPLRIGEVKSARREKIVIPREADEGSIYEGNTLKSPSKRQKAAHRLDDAQSPISPRRTRSTYRRAHPVSTDASKPTAMKAPKKRNRKTFTHKPVPSHLHPLPDSLGPNLHILFVGINPGISTSTTGHAYAHPSNRFWPLLHTSGITPVRCNAPEDRTLLSRYKLGFTNLCARPTKDAAALREPELHEGAVVIEEKVRTWRPEVVCAVGKGVWEGVVRGRTGRKKLDKNEVRYGWQDGENMGRIGAVSGEWEGAKVFVAASTSGLSASLSSQQKEDIWSELGNWVKKRRKEDEKAASEES